MGNKYKNSQREVEAIRQMAEGQLTDESLTTIYNACIGDFCRKMGLSVKNSKSTELDLLHDAILVFRQRVLSGAMYVEGDEIVYHKKDGIRESGKTIVPFVMKIVENLKRENYRKEWPLESFDDGIGADIDCSPYDTLYATVETTSISDNIDEYMDIVRECYLIIRPECERVLTLYYLGDVDFKDIVDDLHLDISADALRERKMRCLNNLRHRFFKILGSTK